MFRIPQPALQGKEDVVAQIDHPAHAVLLSLKEMDLSLLEIDVVHGETEGLADPHACPQKEKDQRAVPGSVDNPDELRYIVGVHGPGEGVGELQSDPFLEKGPRNDFLLHEEVEEGDDGGHPRPYRGDVHAPVLLVLDEGFEVGTFDVPDVPLARRSIKLEEEHDRGEGTVHCSRLVVHPPFVAQVGLEVVLGRKVQRVEPLKHPVDDALFTYSFRGCC